MTGFQAPDHWFNSLDAEAAATLVTAAADLALIVDGAGVVRDVACSDDSLAQELRGHRGWPGQPWIACVTADSRAKVQALLDDPSGRTGPRWRHLNMLGQGGASVAVMASVVPLGADGRRVVVARDLRPLSALQQRLMDAQQSLERDYSRLRDAETRYRVLFRLAAEPLLVLDAATQKVVEANDAATLLLAAAEKRGASRGLLDAFEADSQQAVMLLLAQVRAAGRTETAHARLLADGREALVSASLFRQQAASLLLVRLTFVEGEAGAAPQPPGREQLVGLAENAPDAFVVTDADSRILAANAAFLDLAQLASEEQALSQPLERWLGRPGVDMAVLLSNLRQRGSVRLFETVLRGEYGNNCTVEVSAIGRSVEGRPYTWFAIRDVGARLAALPQEPRDTPRSIEQLTRLIGKVPLRDLVRESTDMIERLCIETALEMTDDNRALAAEMLGLSRQSLYVKLRRYGLGDLGPEAEGS